MGLEVELALKVKLAAEREKKEYWIPPRNFVNEILFPPKVGVELKGSRSVKIGSGGTEEADSNGLEEVTNLVPVDVARGREFVMGLDVEAVTLAAQVDVEEMNSAGEVVENKIVALATHVVGEQMNSAGEIVGIEIVASAAVLAGCRSVMEDVVIGAVKFAAKLLWGGTELSKEKVKAAVKRPKERHRPQKTGNFVDCTLAEEIDPENVMPIVTFWPPKGGTRFVTFGELETKSGADSAGESWSVERLVERGAVIGRAFVIRSTTGVAVWGDRNVAGSNSAHDLKSFA